MSRPDLIGIVDVQGQPHTHDVAAHELTGGPLPTWAEHMSPEVTTAELALAGVYSPLRRIGGALVDGGVIVAGTALGLVLAAALLGGWAAVALSLLAAGLLVLGVSLPLTWGGVAVLFAAGLLARVSGVWAAGMLKRYRS